MLTISLWQPHASLLFITDPAVGRPHKRYETRGWAPDPSLIGTRIGIHAAKATTELESLQDYVRSLRAGGDPDPGDEAYRLALRVRYRSAADVPRGVLLGTVRLLAVHRTETRQRDDWGPFGDFFPGRFAWEVGEAEELPKPLPWRGSQKFFTVPDEVFSSALLTNTLDVT